MTYPVETSDRTQQARRLVELSTVAGRAVSYDDNMRSIQHDAWSLLDGTSRGRDGRSERARLLEAGRDLAEALDEVGRDVAFWNGLATGPFEAGGSPLISFRRELHLREIMDHDIPRLLWDLGYRTPPPPPAEQWAVWFQGSFSRLLSSAPDDAGLGRRAAQAQCELIYFSIRFRRLLDEARISVDSEARQDSTTDPTLARRLLSTALTAARARAIPTAIGLTAGTLATGGLGAVAAGASFVADVGKEVVKTVVEAVAAESIATTQPVLASSGAAERAREALDLLHWVIDRWAYYYATSPGGNSRWHFLVRRAIFDLVQSLEEDASVQHAAWDVARQALDAAGAQDPFGLKDRVQELERLLSTTLRAPGALFTQTMYQQRESAHRTREQEELQRIERQRLARQTEPKTFEQQQRERLERERQKMESQGADRQEAKGKATEQRKFFNL